MVPRKNLRLSCCCHSRDHGSFFAVPVRLFTRTPGRLPLIDKTRRPASGPHADAARAPSDGSATLRMANERSGTCTRWHFGLVTDRCGRRGVSGSASTRIRPSTSASFADDQPLGLAQEGVRLGAIARERLLPEALPTRTEEQPGPHPSVRGGTGSWPGTPGRPDRRPGRPSDRGRISRASPGPPGTSPVDTGRSPAWSDRRPGKG